MQLRYALRGGVWMLVYLFFIMAPLFALLIGPSPPARNFWTEFSVAIGYSGLAIMGLQFGLTARFRYVTTPWARMSSTISTGESLCSHWPWWLCIR
jgi:predicted ferric reductase